LRREWAPTIQQSRVGELMDLPQRFEEAIMKATEAPSSMSLEA
jgi:carbamoylphosphate synthase large subunit